jgi:hypothetical protein
MEKIKKKWSLEKVLELSRQEKFSVDKKNVVKFMLRKTNNIARVIRGECSLIHGNLGDFFKKIWRLELLDDPNLIFPGIFRTASIKIRIYRLPERNSSVSNIQKVCKKLLSARELHMTF